MSGEASSGKETSSVEEERSGEGVTAWRITSAEYQESAFDGAGAEEYGGRFNSVGVPVVYTSATLSLATLEVLTRTNKRSRLAGRVCLPVSFEERHVRALGAPGLPDGWDARPYEPATQVVGDEWIRSESSLVLRVPSVVVPSEANYLINPRHPDASDLEVGEAVPLDPDPRLLRGE